MPTYQELRSTYAQFSLPELRDLARRPFDLTTQARVALAAELSLREIPTEEEILASQTRAPARAASWHGGWLTIFEAWVTLQIVVFSGTYIHLHPSLDWSTLVMLATVAIPGFGLVLIANRRPSAPRFWLRALAVMLVAQITSAATSELPNWRALVWTVIVVAWFMYWLKSARVAREFGLAGQAASPADDC